MTTRTFLALLICPAALVGTTYVIARIGQFGDFAKSPQTAAIWLGGSVVVGGGRAKLWFCSHQDGGIVEVSCKGESHFIGLSSDEQSDEVCGVRLKTVKVEETDGRPPRLHVLVTWNQK
ncbi:MAG TPA: hypothetical protein PLL78_01905 [Fimbriimonadaceae bacterium]|nr:hypothetical protein [Fimbriimonadaceae bacterium]HRJ95412.1 hypothetical protein [Fimbriimonadaceae bacterium]